MGAHRRMITEGQLRKKKVGGDVHNKAVVDIG